MAAVRMLCRAETLGIFVPDHPVETLGQEVMNAVSRSLARSEVARDAAVELLARPEGIERGRYKALLDDVYRSLGECAVPREEWKRLLAVFPPEELAALLAISPSSLRRYTGRSGAVGTRATPDEVADRLHFIALVLDALTGSYNAFGIRRWFQRPFVQLGGRSPRDLLRGEWQSDDSEPGRVREFAEELLSSPAT